MGFYEDGSPHFVRNDAVASWGALVSRRFVEPNTVKIRWYYDLPYGSILA